LFLGIPFDLKNKKYKQMKKRFLLLITLFILFPFLSIAQSYKAEATLDSSRIMIGDHLHVQLKVDASSKNGIIIPQLSQEMLSELGIDLVAHGTVDTVLKENGVTYTQVITVTAFDEGNFYFPSIPIFSLDSNLLTQTDPLNFQVISMQVDTTANFKDIMPIVKVPLTFKEILPYLLLGLLTIAVIVLITILIIKYVGKKKQPNIFLQTKPKGKPEEIALKALEDLRMRSLWQNGKVKQYYSELSTIVRVYIEDRYSINAMEMVSDDILQSVSLKVTTDIFQKLKDLLQVADLVKFAKWSPLPNDHDRCFKESLDFVHATTPAPEKKQNTISDNQNNTEKE
jgi:hypothetical protein